MSLTDMPMLMIFLVSVLAGVILQFVLIRQLHRFAVKSSWAWDDLFWPTFGRMPFLLCLVLGAYTMLKVSGLEGRYHDTLHRLLISLVLLIVTVVVARLAGAGMDGVSGRVRGWLPATTLLTSGTRLLVYVAGAVIILQNMGIKISPIITALGLGGLAVALALQETLNNLFCGIQIIAARLVRPGDYVQLDSGYEGYVTDVKARSTTIRAFPDNNRIIVPNSLMASAIVVNYSLPVENLWITINVGVSYSSDLEQVERVTLEVARDVLSSVEGGIPDQEPVFRYDAFGDSSINYTVRLFVRKFQDQFSIRHEFIKRLHVRYAEEGIEIPFPIRTIHMAQSESEGS